ncbi:MAG TPA: protein kinase [Patescibacteria group bacterium]|nr:protein kinase [Patescibacteria group bacterium]
MYTADQLLGAKFADHYTAKQLIGTGGNGFVYYAPSDSGRLSVAIKVLQPNCDPQQFEQEEQIHEGLNHQYIERFRHYGNIDISDNSNVMRVPYFVMDYAEKGNIRQKMRDKDGTQKPLETAEAVTILSNLTEALQYAHKRGVSHRDIKPENVLVHDDGVRLSDFGIAKTSQLRRVEVLMGSAPYAAPEQFEGDDLLPGSDMYSLGVFGMEIFTGRRPFYGTPEELKIMHKRIHPPSFQDLRKQCGLDMRNDLPELEEVISRSLRKDPKERYADMETFRAAIEEAFRKGVEFEKLHPHHSIPQNPLTLRDATVSPSSPDATTYPDRGKIAQTPTEHLTPNLQPPMPQSVDMTKTPDKQQPVTEPAQPNAPDTSVHASWYLPPLENNQTDPIITPWINKAWRSERNETHVASELKGIPLHELTTVDQLLRRGIYYFAPRKNLEEVILTLPAHKVYADSNQLQVRVYPEWGYAFRLQFFDFYTQTILNEKDLILKVEEARIIGRETTGKQEVIKIPVLGVEHMSPTHIHLYNIEDGLVILDTNSTHGTLARMKLPQERLLSRMRRFR